MKGEESMCVGQKRGKKEEERRRRIEVKTIILDSEIFFNHLFHSLMYP